MREETSVDFWHSFSSYILNSYTWLNILVSHTSSLFVLVVFFHFISSCLISWKRTKTKVYKNHHHHQKCRIHAGPVLEYAIRTIRVNMECVLFVHPVVFWFRNACTRKRMDPSVVIVKLPWPGSNTCPALRIIGRPSVIVPFHDAMVVRFAIPVSDNALYEPFC